MPQPFLFIEKFIHRLAILWALFGGMILLSLTAITTISIIGRNLTFIGLGPIPGDVELVEIGMAIAIATFLPLCQYHRGHASVDLITRYIGAKAGIILTLLSDVLMLGIALLITWRLWAGLADKQSAFFPEVSQILGIPIWWAYVGCFSGLVVFTLVSCFTLAKNSEDA